MPAKEALRWVLGTMVLSILSLNWYAMAQAWAGQGSTPPAAATTQNATTEPGGVTVTVIPSAVSLVPGDVASVDLVITNLYSTAVTVTGLDVRAPARIAPQAIPDPNAVGTVLPNNFVRTSFEIRALRGLEEGEVHVIVEIQHSPSAKGASRELASAHLSVKAGKATQALEVSVLSSPAKLNDGQHGIASVRIFNPTPFPFKGVRVSGIDSENVTLGGDKTPRLPFVDCPPDEPVAPGLIGCVGDIPPGEARVVAFNVRADDRVRTGKQQVTVAVVGNAAGSAEDIASAPIVTMDVELAVFGIDAISPFGVGTLFVLPGLLAVVTFSVLYRYAYPRRGEFPENVEFKDPRLMLVVVPVSAFAYFLVLLILNHDVTSEASTEDVVALFVLGVLIGGLAWAVLAVFYYQRTDRKQFRLDDSPAQVLERLDARDAGLNLPKVAINGLTYRYLSEGPNEQLTVCPPINWSFTSGATQQSQSDFNQAIDDDDVATVRNHISAGIVTLAWRLPSGVRRVAQANARLESPEKLLLEEQG